MSWLYPGRIGNDAFRQRHPRYTTKQTGWYGALRLNLADPLKLIVGGAAAPWKTDATGFFRRHGDRCGVRQERVHSVCRLLYDINENYTAYVSHTSIFNPQSFQDRNGNWLDPLEGKSPRPASGEFLEGRLNASAAVFQVDQDNVAQEDPGHMVPGTINPAYTAAQGTRSRGFDLEVSGELTPGWNLAAGWSHWTASDGEGNAIQTDQPRSLVRLFTTYQLPGEWNRLTVGGGVNWQSHVYSIASGPNGNERVGQGSYAITNLMARYRFNRNLSAQLNVNNLFDRQYYSQIGFYNQGAWRGPQRHADDALPVLRRAGARAGASAPAPASAFIRCMLSWLTMMTPEAELVDVKMKVSTSAISVANSPVEMNCLRFCRPVPWAMNAMAPEVTMKSR